MPMDFIEIRSFDNYQEAHVVVEMLRNARINCHLKDDHLTADRSLSPAVGGMKLMIYHADVEHAWDLMEKAEQEYLKNIPCPVCKSHSLKAVSITRHHTCRLSALASMMLNGHPMELDKLYKCMRCGYDFKDLD